MEDLSSIVVLAIMFRYVKGCGTENESALDGKETRLASAYNAGLLIAKAIWAMKPEQ